MSGSLKGGFKPVKYFSIDRVYRNETLDTTHLAEFHQIEGVIADYGLTLGNLIGKAFLNNLPLKVVKYVCFSFQLYYMNFSASLASKNFVSSQLIILTLSPAWKFSAIMPD